MSSSDGREEWTIPQRDLRFNILDYNRQKPEVVPDEYRNKRFNRFLDVVPQAETRVPLDGPVRYINASFVHAADGTPREYIAAMGPLPATIKCFWRMIWQHRVSVVVMATGLKERGKVKCERYWPEDTSAPTKYGDYTVEKVEEVELEGAYVRAELCITEASSGEKRRLTHFWYNSWPDHGVPKLNGRPYPGHAMDILRDARAAQTEHDGGKPRASPLLVHCSAGVGRTGALIAIEHCLELLHTKKTVDPCAVVERIRRDRMALVQHASQYQLVYEACIQEARAKNIRLMVGRAAMTLGWTSGAAEATEEAPPGMEADLLVAATAGGGSSSSSRGHDVGAHAGNASGSGAGKPGGRGDPVPNVPSSDSSSSTSSSDAEEDGGSLLKRSETRRLKRMTTFLSKTHEDEPWYHGEMDRSQAEALIKSLPAASIGNFLVRKSTSARNQYAVSFIGATPGKIHHNRVTYHRGRYIFNNTMYRSLSSFIKYHQRDQGSFQVRLTEPIIEATFRSRLNTVEFTDDDFVAMSRPVSNAATQSAALAKHSLRHAGWLTKQGAGMFAGAASKKASGIAQLFSRKSWKRRYFVLQDTMLKYYKKDTALPPDALGYINMSSDVHIEHNVEDTTGASATVGDAPRTFYIHTAYRIWAIVAEDEADARAWVMKLKNAVEKAKKAATARLAASLKAATIVEE